MINLNSDNFKEKEFAPRFNAGKAGRVSNVTIAVTKKTAADADNLPDYKLIVTDENKGEVNEGFYYAADGDDSKGKLLANRVLHIARAVLGADYEFPEYATYKDVVDGLFKLIKKNADGKTFSVFVTYGNIGYPSQFLKLRYFDFIESGDVAEEATRLYKKKNDLMIKMTEDAPMSKPAASMEGTDDSENDDDWV